MILIDSLHVNSGGGKVLLDYLVEKLEGQKIEPFYIFDDRCINDYGIIPENRKIYLKANYRERWKFYRKHKNSFKSILCFGNLPPTHKTNAKVISYFHQLLFLSTEGDFSLKTKISLKLKRAVLSCLTKNSDYWAVQNKFIQERLSKRYKIEKNNVLVLPFYPPIPDDGVDYKREDNAFVYISGASPHKNHAKLIDAFCQFYDEYKVGKLTLTVSERSQQIFELINKKINLGYPINNIGFVARERLYKVYKESEYLIFPSLAESFGLGLIEAIDNGCKVIASDLPYVYQVCEPSLTFDPTDTNSIKQAFIRATQEKPKETTPLISNKIDELITLIKS